MVSWSELILPDAVGEPNMDTYRPDCGANPWAVLEGLDLGLALWSPDGVLLRCNALFVDLLGQRNEVCRPGASLQQVLMLAGLRQAGSRQASAWIEQMLTAHRKGGEVEWRGKDGQWWQALFTRLPDGKRLCRVLNVSNQKRLEQEVRHLGEISEREAPLARGLAHMGHELRTPLNAILGFSDLIRSEAIGPLGNPSYADYANDIHDSGQVLLSAVDRIALLVKLEAGLVRPQSETVTAAVLIAMAVETVEPLAAAAGVVLEFAGDDDSETTLFVDRFLVSSALTYLLENAVAATDAPGRVGLHCRRTAEGGLAFEVRDRGRGIEPEALAAIREPFVRFDSANPQCPAGVGMGLPVADRMAQLLGCDIALESAPQAGTLARLTVPADRVVAA
ncbi:MAG: hypothetical protein KDC18_00870 [Alphaproteobacteria bacterium]|nr:hypothetical protein [Alphaproteobacteria bacterium]MCB9931491.1 hypothetical protein [Alphaproteobacteria bacterium]